MTGWDSWYQSSKVERLTGPPAATAAAASAGSGARERIRCLCGSHNPAHHKEKIPVKHENMTSTEQGRTQKGKSWPVEHTHSHTHTLILPQLTSTCTRKSNSVRLWKYDMFELSK